MKIDLFKVPDDKALDSLWKLLLPLIQGNSQSFKRITESSFQLGKIKIRMLPSQLIITFLPKQTIKVPLKSITHLNIVNNLFLINNTVAIQF